jgi:hypothetical protein
LYAKFFQRFARERQIAHFVERPFISPTLSMIDAISAAVMVPSRDSVRNSLS